MSNQQRVLRDERTVAVENVSYKWAFAFVTFALLVDVMYRGLFRNEAAWDLMALACVPGIICSIYYARQTTLTAHDWVTIAVLAICSAAVAFVIAALYQFRLLH